METRFQLGLSSVNSRSLEIGIAKDKLVMLLAEKAPNLWTMALEP